MREQYTIVHLPKEQWRGTVLPMRYTTEDYYDVRIEEEPDAYRIEMRRCRSGVPVTHSPEEYDFPDRLYQPHWEKAFAWGIIEKEEGREELLACIETCPEEWSNRLIVTELWVHEKLRRQGIGHALMSVAKEQAVLEHRRAVILETQSCNTAAIGFYQREGFELAGFDSCCYSNSDVERREVRIDMGYFLRKKKKELKRILVRRESESEYRRTEEVVLKAFWNRYRPGCDEHLLVHKLRASDAYLPELSRIAVAGDEIVGVICYCRAFLKNGERQKEILIFGPLCVAPSWQGCGVGSLLLRETLALAVKSGYEGVIIFGEPDYYPRHGFVACDRFGITTADGKNSDAFMGLELVDGGLSGFGGAFYVPDVYYDLSEEENRTFTALFDAPAMRKFPCQWH